MIIIFMVYIFLLCAIGPWITFRIWGETNHLGLFIVLCRRYKLTKWLAWNVWGNDSWYYEKLEKRMKEWRQMTS